MNIPKAIEILELNIKEASKQMPPDCLDALKLGIEALERTIARRERLSWKLEPLLPSETLK